MGLNKIYMLSSPISFYFFKVATRDFNITEWLALYFHQHWARLPGRERRSEGQRSRLLTVRLRELKARLMGDRAWVIGN